MFTECHLPQSHSSSNQKSRRLRISLKHQTILSTLLAYLCEVGKGEYSAQGTQKTKTEDKIRISDVNAKGFHHQNTIKAKYQLSFFLIRDSPPLECRQRFQGLANKSITTQNPKTTQSVC